MLDDEKAKYMTFAIMCLCDVCYKCKVKRFLKWLVIKKMKSEFAF